MPSARGYSAAETLHRWDSVQRGERLHIFPFTENSDAIFNSSLAHELSVLRPLAEPLLLQVRHDTPQYREASRLLSFLQWFRPAAPDVVPDNSILREFIGGSILREFPVEAGVGWAMLLRIANCGLWIADCGFINGTRHARSGWIERSSPAVLRLRRRDA